MSYQISPSGMRHLDGVGVDLDAEFLGEVASGPHVVVAQVPMHIKPAVYQFSQFAKQAHRAFGDDVAPFKPKVNEITHQMKRIAVAPYLLQPGQKRPLPLPRRSAVRST